MRLFLLLSIALLAVSCCRYHEQEIVQIKLNGCRGTIIRCNEFNQSYKIRYVDNAGVCHTEQFEEFELQNY